MCHKFSMDINRTDQGTVSILHVTYLSWSVMDINGELDKFFAEKRKNIEKIGGKSIELIRNQSYLPIDDYITQFTIKDHVVIISGDSEHYIKVPLTLIINFELIDIKKHYHVPEYITDFIKYVNDHKGLCEFENGFPEWFKDYIAVALKDEKQDENKAKAMID